MVTDLKAKKHFRFRVKYENNHMQMAQSVGLVLFGFEFLVRKTTFFTKKAGFSFLSV